MVAAERLACLGLVALSAAGGGGCSSQQASPAFDGGAPCNAGGTCAAGLVCDRTTGTCASAPGSFGDCREVGLTCFAPYECGEYEPGKHGCRFPAPGPVTCKGTPAGQVVPFTTVTGENDGVTVHWPLAGGCIPVTYEPALTGYRSGISAAARVWSDVDCARACFSDATESMTTFAPARGERRIHFLLGDAGPDPAFVQVFFELDSGRAIGAEVTIAPAHVGSLEGRDMIRLFGYALGLGTAKGSSVMAEDREATTITNDDRLAICLLYGDAPYCGE